MAVRTTLALICAVCAAATPAFADASNPWPAVGKVLESNECRITEAQLVATLRAEGVYTWTTNIMVANFSRRDGVSFDQAAGAYMVRGMGAC